MPLCVWYVYDVWYIVEDEEIFSVDELNTSVGIPVIV